MSGQEFSERFDILFNNITSNQAPGLSCYEVSVFLTKAQDEILKNYFNPKGNKFQEGYDGSQKRQVDFSKLTKVKEYLSSAKPNPFERSEFDRRDESRSVLLEPDVMFIVNEHVIVTRNGSPVDLTVKPVSYEEYDKLMSKPYKRPLKYQAWRLINCNSARTSDIIVGPGDIITSYSIRYIKRPRPIIVGDLYGLTIDNCYLEGTSPIAGATAIDGNCEFDETLHEEILQRAVELAKVAWASTGDDSTQMMLQAGQRSE